METRELNAYEKILGMPCPWCQRAESEDQAALRTYEADILACNRVLTLMEALGLDASLAVPVEMIRKRAYLAGDRERVKLDMPKRGTMH